MHRTGLMEPDAFECHARKVSALIAEAGKGVIISAATETALRKGFQTLSLRRVPDRHDRGSIQNHGNCHRSRIARAAFTGAARQRAGN